MQLSVLMPVFNEALTVIPILNRLASLPLDLEIVIVNDGSSDDSSGVIASCSSACIKVIHHDTNCGKGAAVQTALKAATGDVVVIQDADLEYAPLDILDLLKPIRDGWVDVVYGVRTLESQKTIMRLGNRFITFACNLIYNQELKDIATCYKVMRREIALSLDLESRRFDIDAEITAKLLSAGYPICELPIRYTARYENKKLSPFDGFPTLRALWKYRKWTPRTGVDTAPAEQTT